jgi:hypothetical protein
VIEEMHIYIAGGEGRGILGIYENSVENRPGKLIATGEPFEIDEVNEWYHLRLNEPLHVSAGTTLWLAWMFDRGVFLPSDGRERRGELGSSRMVISTYRWTDPPQDALPHLFPRDAALDFRITTIYAAGIP